MKIASNIIYFLTASILITYIFFEAYLPVELTKNLFKMIVFWSSIIAIAIIEVIKNLKRKKNE